CIAPHPAPRAEADMVVHLSFADERARVFVFLAARLFVPGCILDGGGLADEMISLHRAHHTGRVLDHAASFWVVAFWINRPAPGRDAIVNEIGEIRLAVLRARCVDSSPRGVDSLDPVTYQAAMYLEARGQLR